MTKNTIVTPPDAHAAPSGQEKQQTRETVTAEIRRQEQILIELERNLKPFKIDLEKKPRRTREENRQLNALFDRLGELEHCRTRLRVDLLGKIAMIVDLPGLLKKIQTIGDAMREEAGKIRGLSSALETGAKVVTLANKTREFLDGRA